MMHFVGPTSVPRVVPHTPSPSSGGGESIFWPLLFAVVVLVVLFFLFRQVWRERKGGPDDDSGWDWRRWDGPDDWPELPKAPKGTGPVPDYVPDEWVHEAFGPPPQLTKVSPPESEV